MAGTYTHTVILSNPTTQNPFTVTSSGAVLASLGDGILGTAGFAWTLNNFGTISTTDTLGIGVDLTAGGLVIDGQSGSTGDFAYTSVTSIKGGDGTPTAVNSGTVVASLGLTGTYTSNDFALSSDSSGGVDIALSQPAGRIIGASFYGTVNLNNNTYNGTTYNNSVTITSTGTLTGPFDAVYGGGTAGTLANYGTITQGSTGGHGVNLGQGGSVTNIAGSTGGGYIFGSGAGVTIGGVGTVMNTGTILGGVGVGASAGATITITNSGTIVSTAGTGGTAVSLAGGTSRLIVDPGAVFTGVVDGGGGASVLEIAALSGTAASRSGPGEAQGAVASVTLGSVVNFSVAQIDPSATLDNSGVISFDTLVNQGWINVLSGASLALGTVADAGSTGIIDLQQGGTIDFQGAVANQTVIFQPPGGTAAIDQTGTFGGVLSGFTVAGDIVDLTGLVGGTLANGGSVNGSDQLVVGNATQSAVLQLDTSGDYTGIVWHTSADSGTGTDVAAACFCRGTLILTERGEVPVEDLAIGDRVMTVSGAARAIKWIGRRAYHPRFVAKNRKVLPIRIEAGALAHGVPARDLWVSPEHALYIREVLVPAHLLVNGATITQVETIDRLEYFHIELDTHDVILADGAPAETFVDCDNRGIFQNAREFAALYPDAVPPSWEFCAPRLEEGAPELAAIRRGVLARAEVFGRLTRDPDLHLVVDDTTVRPQSVENDRLYRFPVPAGSRSVSLVSRAMVPANVEISPADGRRLGVAVERIVLRDARANIEIGYASPTLADGFYEPEGSHRWTDGEGHLPSGWLAAFAGDLILEVHLAETEMRYGLDAPAAGVKSTKSHGRAVMTDAA